MPELMDSLSLLLLAFLTFLTLFALSLLFSLYYQMYRATLFTVVDLDFALTISDPKGKHATFTKTMQLRANHKGLSEYIHRNLSADGSMGNFRVDDREPEKIQKDAGDLLIYVRFPHPLSRGEVIKTTLSADMLDSFCSTTEWVTYMVTYPTKKVTITVNLPEGRPASAAEMYRFRGGEIERIPDPVVLLNNNHRLVWTATDLRHLGTEYRLQWSWPEA